MRNLALVLIALFCIRCTENLDINQPHEPIIQLDAVFYANDSLPVMEIKQSFKGSGTYIYEIPKSAIFLTGAEVNLKWNGKSIAVKEESIGKYRGISSERIKMGDVFEIEVKHGGRTVTSRAEVPNYPVENIQFSAQKATNLRRHDHYYQDSNYHNTDTLALWEGEAFIKLTIPFIADFFALRTESIDRMEDSKIRGYYAGNYQDYEKYSKDEFTGIDTLTFFETYFLFQADSARVVGEQAKASVLLKFVIAEPIYGEFHNSRDYLLISNTVTNVKNGLGLFFGAIRVEKDYEVPVNAVYLE
jgi:hypothetical protein